MAKSKAEQIAETDEAAFVASRNAIFDRAARQLWANLWDGTNERTDTTITISQAMLRAGLLRMRNSAS